MKIAKIVTSNSHIDYIGRVVDDLDTAAPPNFEDYGFGQLSLCRLRINEIIGVIYNSLLVNPEYAITVRAFAKTELGNFSPDYLNEQGFLIEFYCSARNGAGKSARRSRRVVPAGQDVYKIEPDAIKKFHTDESDCLQIHYYSQIVAHAGLFAVPLLEAIIEQLSLDCSESDRQRLGVLKQTLSWQRTMGGMRL